MRAVIGDRLFIAEVYVSIERLMRYYAGGAQMPFNFHLLGTPWEAEAIGDLVERYEAALPDGAWPNWVLGNHDRPRIASRVGAAQARVAAMLLLTLRGTPTLYYGDELGMTDVAVERYDFRGRDAERTPMQWTRDGGFTDRRAVAAVRRPGGQRRAGPNPMLELHRRLIALRRELRRGGLPDAARGRRRARLRARRRPRGGAQSHRRAAPAAGRGRARAQHPSRRRRAASCGPTRAWFLESDACSRPDRSSCSARWSTASTRPASRSARRRSPPTPTCTAGASTIRNELAVLEEQGLLAHPHTSAGRVPTDAGYRYFVDRLLPARREARPELQLSLVRREVDEAMRVTTETLSQVTNLLAIVSAPPIATTTLRHVEVLPLQPQVLMVVVITSTGGVSKRVFTFDRPVDPGLADWAAAYLNEQLAGMGIGSRMLQAKLNDPGLQPRERAFIAQLAPAFTELAMTAENTLYVDGAARLLSEHRFQDVSQLNELLDALERRVSLLGLLSRALDERDIYVRIGGENEMPALRSLSLVAGNYGLPQRNLGTVSVIGPMRMDYARAIITVREAAQQLSRFVEDIYESS